MSFKKYQQYPIVQNFKREWADKSITKAPIYCSVDLRDGNQALINPLCIYRSYRTVMPELYRTLLQ